MPEPLFLPKEVFLETFKQVPRLAISLLLVNSAQQFVLTKRANDPLVDHWHLPGSFVLKNEPLRDCVLRIGRDELDMDLNQLEMSFVGVYQNLQADPRGHVVDLVYKITADQNFDLHPHNDTKEIHFFDRIPEPMGFNHQHIILDQIPSLTDFSS